MEGPITYSWNDPGGPALNLTGNLQNRIKQVLVPCLVTGYTNKPAAGWSLAHEHSNGFTLGNARGDFFINFVSNMPAHNGLPAMNKDIVVVYAANSCIDNGGAIIDGANLCSGLYRKSINNVTPESTRHIAINFGLISNIMGVWSVIADERTFVVNLVGSNGAGYTIYCGDIQGFNGLDYPIVLGGNIGTLEYSVATRAYCGGFSAPRALTTGLDEKVAIASLPYWHSSLYPVTGSKLPDRLSFSRVPVIDLDGKSFVGYLRGVANEESFYCSGAESVDKRSHIHEGGGVLNGEWVEIDGHRYLFAISADRGSFLTSLPAFWQ